MLLALMLLVGDCGSERWAVKTLTDTAAADINFAPVDTTVEDLVELEAPKYRDARPRSGAEFQVVALEADVVGFKLESDQDFHVVIRGQSGTTMIIEFPDPACAARSRFRADIAAARTRFLRFFMMPKQHFLRLKERVHVRLTGVGFFDKRHGQVGLAQDGIELHPVLTIEVP